MTIALTATVVAIAIILLTANIPITNAQQQQQQPLSSQPAVTQNGTTLFQSTEDGIRLNVPEGWVIHDVNNTGSTLSEESTQGYGILAQLCTEEEEQQQGATAAHVLTLAVAAIQPVAKDLKETSYTSFGISTWTLDSKGLIMLLLLLILPIITT